MSNKTPLCCGRTGPGFKTPLEAMQGQKEEMCYLPCIQPFPEDEGKPDYVVTVDLNPKSPTYSQVIHRLYMPYVGDELHHLGWNVCSSCHHDSTKMRDRLVLPAVCNDRVYIIDVGTNPRQPRIHKIVEPDELYKLNASAPHSVHCIPTGEVLISIMGTKDQKAQGTFLELDKDFNVKGLWPSNNKSVSFGYDFWYQPRQNAMVSTEFGHPEIFKKGFKVSDVLAGKYGHHIHVWKWNERELLQSIDLGPEGMFPFEIRFLHNPDRAEGFVCCALSSTVFRFYRKQDGTWDADKVITIPNKKVLNWALPEMPGLTTDIVISMDDKYLYLNNYLHGDIRQFDITDTRNPKQVGQIFIGGSVCSDGMVKVIEDVELKEQPKPLIIKGKRVEGAPQMMQLTLDGKRLYFTTSLLSSWDRQFYIDMARKGSVMLLLDVDINRGGLKLNKDFFVDFGLEPGGPVLAHEIRYPGGDCTSDIWI